VPAQISAEIPRQLTRQEVKDYRDRAALVGQVIAEHDAIIELDAGHPPILLIEPSDDTANTRARANLINAAVDARWAQEILSRTHEQRIRAAKEVFAATVGWRIEQAQAEGPDMLVIEQDISPQGKIAQLEIADENLSVVPSRAQINRWDNGGHTARFTYSPENRQPFPSDKLSHLQRRRLSLNSANLSSLGVLGESLLVVPEPETEINNVRHELVVGPIARQEDGIDVHIAGNRGVTDIQYVARTPDINDILRITALVASGRLVPPDNYNSEL